MVSRIAFDGRCNHIGRFLTRVLSTLLDDAACREGMRAEMARVRSLLGTPGASARAAAVVLDQLRLEGAAR